jgi:F-type H+-transporting ATPase subunit k
MIMMQLAMATLGTTFAIAAFSLRGGKKEDGPPIGAGSKEEESFVK